MLPNLLISLIMIDDKSEQLSTKLKKSYIFRFLALRMKIHLSDENSKAALKKTWTHGENVSSSLWDQIVHNVHNDLYLIGGKMGSNDKS